MTDEIPIFISDGSSSGGSSSFDDISTQSFLSDSSTSPKLNVEADPILRSSASGELPKQPVKPELPSFLADQSGQSDPAVPIQLDWGVSLNPGTGHAREQVADQSMSGSQDGWAEPEPSNLPFILLASYASAVTLALLWVLFTGRTLAPPEPREVYGEQPTTARRAKESARLPRAEKIPAERLVALDRTIRVGALELTPLEVYRGPIRLQRTTNPDEERDGGADALILKLRFRNISDETRFTPLDESYLRDPDRGSPQSFIQLGTSERVYLYPLAIESEWKIEGQAFPSLNPGEVAESIIVSSPRVGSVGTESIVWRIRLRTGFDQSENIGVTLDPDQIKVAP